MDEFDDSELRAAGRRWRDALSIEHDAIRDDRRPPRLKGRRRLLPGLAMAATVVAVLALSATAFLARGHLFGGAQTSHSRTATGPGAPNGELEAVACPTATVCLAFGTYDDTAGQTQILAERWNGTSWTRLSVPGPSGTAGITSVACATANRCVAVGGSHTGPSTTPSRPYALTWDGQSWSTSPLPAVPDPSASLGSVDCVTAALCYAAGFRANADGTGSQPLVLRYASGTWTVRPTPVVDVYPIPDTDRVSGGRLTGVSCSSAAFCAAVGFADSATGTRHAWSMTLTDGRWTKVLGPLPAQRGGAQLTGVSCPVDGSCVAVGQDAITQLGYDGTAYAAQLGAGSTWTNLPTATLDFASTLDAVSCIDTTECLAAGFSSDTKFVQGALAERLTGDGFRRTTAADISAVTYNGVSCYAVEACVVVGFTSTGPFVPVAERYRNGTWTNLHPLLGS